MRGKMIIIRIRIRIITTTRIKIEINEIMSKLLRQRRSSKNKGGKKEKRGRSLSAFKISDQIKDERKRKKINK